MSGANESGNGEERDVEKGVVSSGDGGAEGGRMAQKEELQKEPQEIPKQPPASLPPSATIPAGGDGPPKLTVKVKAPGDGQAQFTEHEMHIINDLVAFREFCLVSQRGMLDSLGKVRTEQKAQREREGELAAHMALAMLDNAKLHDQFKHKSVSRAIAEKLNALATAAGVNPIDAEAFATEHWGPEASMEPKAKKESAKGDKPSGSKRKQSADGEENQSAKKPKLDGTGSGSSQKVKPKATTENWNVADDDRITLPGGLHSRENDVILSKWGLKGTGIKGKPGCIIRIPVGGELKLPSAAVQHAKAAAAEVAHKNDRKVSPKGFGGTLAKYVETVLDLVVDKKKEHAPFHFQPLVGLETFSGKVMPKTLNDAQATIWGDLLRNAYKNMELQGTDASIAVQGVDAAIKMLQKKVDSMGKAKSKKTVPEKRDRQDEDPQNETDYDF